MIRVELGREIDGHGIFVYSLKTATHSLVERRSREPLLDACRQLKRMGEAGSSIVGLFREGWSKPDATCSVEWGAAHTVSEVPSPHFTKYNPPARLRAQS